MLDEIRLIRDRRELDGNLYFEFLPGEFDGQFWNDGSVYVAEEVFGYLERMFVLYAPLVEHYSFANVPREQWYPLLQHLTQFAAQLDVATNMDDVRGDLEFVFRDSEERFAADFEQNARAFAALIRELVAWVGEQLETRAGVAILGI
jgi:hypothetical protein